MTSPPDYGPLELKPGALIIFLTRLREVMGWLERMGEIDGIAQCDITAAQRNIVLVFGMARALLPPTVELPSDYGDLVRRLRYAAFGSPAPSPLEIRRALRLLEIAVQATVINPGFEVDMRISAYGG